MIKFTKGAKERWAPKEKTDLLVSWGWTPETGAKSNNANKYTVEANPTVVTPKEDEDNQVNNENLEGDDDGGFSR